MLRFFKRRSKPAQVQPPPPYTPFPETNFDGSLFRLTPNKALCYIKFRHLNLSHCLKTFGRDLLNSEENDEIWEILPRAVLLSFVIQPHIAVDPLYAQLLAKLEEMDTLLDEMARTLLISADSRLGNGPETKISHAKKVTVFKAGDERVVGKCLLWTLIQDYGSIEWTWVKLEPRGSTIYQWKEEAFRKLWKEYYLLAMEYILWAKKLGDMGYMNPSKKQTGRK